MLFVVGCQNRNQVTHNKRKYRKGYYKPNRAKVNRRKGQQEEKYAYNSDDKGEQNQSTRKEAKEITYKPSSSSKNNKEKSIISPTNDKEVHSDREIEENNNVSENKQYSQSNSQTERPQEKEGKTRADLPKQNWMYWLDLVLIFVVLFLIILTVVLYVATASLLLAILMTIGTFLLDLLGLITAAINLKNTKEGKEHAFTRFSNHAYILVFVLLLLLTLGAFVLIILDGK